MSIAACASLIERGDPDRFQAVMAAPVWMRELLIPLYAFNLEVARAPWVSAEPMIGEMRLQWWRDVVENTAEGQPRAHEVAGPVHAVINDTGLPLDVLDALVEARRWDLYRDAFADEAAFEAYIEATGAGLMWLAARAVGAPDGAEPVARAYGWAAGLAGFLRAVPELEARGRIPLLDGRSEAVADLARRGLRRLDEARSLGKHFPRAAAAALLSGWQTRGLLQLAASDPLAVAEGRLKLSEFARRGGLLWQAVSGRW